MTDPFMLDQREVEVSLERLQDAVAARRSLQGGGGGANGGGGWTDAKEYQLQGLDGFIRNGIRDASWSLAELGETLRLLTEHEAHFAESDRDLNSRRTFLESARKTLASIELEILASPPSQPPQPPPPPAADDEGNGSWSSSENDSQEQRPCIEPQEATGGNGRSSWKKKNSGMMKLKKSVSWHRHVQSPADDGGCEADEVRVVDKAAWMAASRPMLRRVTAGLMKYRVWISLAVVLALFALVLFVIAVSKANRVLLLQQARASHATDTTAAATAATTYAPESATTEYEWPWG